MSSISRSFLSRSSSTCLTFSTQASTCSFNLLHFHVLTRRSHNCCFRSASSRRAITIHRVLCFDDPRFVAPVRGLRYHADSSIYIILSFPLNHYACVHVRHTARGGTPHNPDPDTRQEVQQVPRTVTSSPTISCSYWTQSYISTRRSVDQNPGSEHTETGDFLGT